MSRPAAKLTPAQVVEIREQLAVGARKGDLAARYQVSVEAIRKIRRGHTWRTLDDAPRTHCRRGHSFAEHGYIAPRGKRYCRECRRERESGPRLTREAYLEVHEGHELRIRVDGQRYCLTCWRGADDVDEAVVARAAAGEPFRNMTIAERWAAIDLCLAAGLSQRATARQLGISDRTVVRRAAERRAA